MKFYSDLVRKEYSFQQDLFKIVNLSKDHPDVAIAAANAISILNMAEVNFAGMNL